MDAAGPLSLIEKPLQRIGRGLQTPDKQRRCTKDAIAATPINIAQIRHVTLFFILIFFLLTLFYFPRAKKWYMKQDWIAIHRLDSYPGFR